MAAQETPSSDTCRPSTLPAITNPSATLDTLFPLFSVFTFIGLVLPSGPPNPGKKMSAALLDTPCVARHELTASISASPWGASPPVPTARAPGYMSPPLVTVVSAAVYCFLSRNPALPLPHRPRRHGHYGRHALQHTVTSAAVARWHSLAATHRTFSRVDATLSSVWPDSPPRSSRLGGAPRHLRGRHDFWRVLASPAPPSSPPPSSIAPRTQPPPPWTAYSRPPVRLSASSSLVVQEDHRASTHVTNPAPATRTTTPRLLRRVLGVGRVAWRRIHSRLDVLWQRVVTVVHLVDEDHDVRDVLLHIVVRVDVRVALLLHIGRYDAGYHTTSPS
ncbi:hypothetical protein C8R46DRAFT_1226170 [Mycena filopes]|nr:hypothetical protein C8R46DRAFT_1226170 [Mycena filopes]